MDYGLAEYSDEFKEIMRRIIKHPGMLGIVVTENQREPIFSTIDNNRSYLVANSLCDLREMANHVVRVLDPEDELVVIRIKTTKYEIMDVLASKDRSIIALQKPN